MLAKYRTEISADETKAQNEITELLRDYHNKLNDEYLYQPRIKCAEQIMEYLGLDKSTRKYSPKVLNFDCVLSADQIAKAMKNDLITQIVLRPSLDDAVISTNPPTDTSEKISDAETIAEMLNEFITANSLNARIVNDENYPAHKGKAIVDSIRHFMITLN